MRGSVIEIPDPGSQGLIAGNDGYDYWFTEAGWRDPNAAKAPGMSVEFTARGQRATDVHPEGAMVAIAAPVVYQGGAPPPPPPPPPPHSSQGQYQSQNSGGAPPNPQPGNNGQQKRGGNMLAALRAMGMIFLLTPVALPMLILLPLLGRLEFGLMTLAPGFLGGIKAGGLKRAIFAAIMVGACYGLIHYLLIFALFHSLAGLIGVGSYVQALVDFFGGYAIATALVTLAITSPFIIALLASSLAGALAARATSRFPRRR